MWFSSLLSFRQQNSRGRSTRQRSPVPRQRSLRLECLEDRTALSTLTVLNNLDKGTGSLRHTIAHAREGDTIDFAAGLAGQTITLTSGSLDVRKSLNVAGPGAGLLAISGNDTSRVFDLSAGLTVTISGLTITRGLGKGDNFGGGGILNVGSALTVAHAIFSSNEAHQGGAINNDHGGALTVIESTFVENRSIVDVPAMAARGAAIFSDRGSTATVTGSTFTGNRSMGASDVVCKRIDNFSGHANGGAITNYGGSVLYVEDSTFTDNRSVGGSRIDGGKFETTYFISTGTGGAIQNHDVSTLYVNGCTFRDNQAIGGSNSTGSTGGQGHVSGGVGGALHNEGYATITNSTFDHNEARGGSGNTGGSGVLELGLGRGGAIANVGVLGFPGQLTASNLTLTNNRAVGGDGNVDGDLVGVGFGGGLANFRGTSTVTLSNSTLANNQAVGGAGAAGGNGGSGLGGGIFTDATSTLTLRGATITANEAIGGAPGAGGSAGLGVGGGVYVAPGGTAYADVLTLIFGNVASTSGDDVFGDLYPL